jgi:hypothetical protein
MGKQNRAVPLAGLDLPALMPGEAPVVRHLLLAHDEGLRLLRAMIDESGSTANNRLLALERAYEEIGLAIRELAEGASGFKAAVEPLLKDFPSMIDAALIKRLEDLEERTSTLEARFPHADNKEDKDELHQTNA